MTGLSCAVFLPQFDPCSSLPDSKAEQTLSATAPALHRLREAFRKIIQSKEGKSLLRTCFDLALVCEHGEPRVAFAQPTQLL